MVAFANVFQTFLNVCLNQSRSQSKILEGDTMNKIVELSKFDLTAKINFSYFEIASKMPHRVSCLSLI